MSLRPLVESVVYREAAKEKVDIKIEIDENLEVVAHAELLSRALANVVRNALHYAGRAGEICIVAHNGNEQVEITVADNGPGVPENEIDKLFDPFY